MRRCRTAALLLTLAIALAACSGTSEDNPNAKHPALAKELRGQLLTTSDLGEDWEIDRSGDDDSSNPECIQKAQDAVRDVKSNELAKAERSFDIPNKPASIDEELVRFSTSRGVLAAVTKVFDGCTTFSVKSGDQTLNLHMSRTSLSNDKDVVVYRLQTKIKVKGQRRSAGGLMVVGIKAETLVLLEVFTLPPVGATEVSPISQAAFQKVD